MLASKIKNQGYSLVEIIFYVSILSLFFVIIVNSIISFTRPYREILSLRLVERSALDSMERMTRDIRGATSIDASNSTLDTSPGVLTLISTYDSISTTTKFYLDSGVLKVDVNGIYEGPLTTSRTSVTNLVFRQITGTNSSAVRIEMTIQSSIGTSIRSKKYYTTTILKLI
ncbi:MAG: hypothetical protein WAX44_02165 [Minisyncoccia bacterium]